MRYLLCRHIKTNGIRCSSPALKTGEHCFFHTRLYQRHSSFRQPPSERMVPGCHIELSPLEDHDAIQVNLSVVVNALATGALETQRAKAILYGLQLASSNAARITSHLSGRDVVQTVTVSPEGLDLAQAGSTYEIADLPAYIFEGSDDDEYDDEEEEEDDQYV